MRDSQLDNKYQEDASFRMIKAYEEIIDQMKADKQLEDPPIPDEKNTKPPVVAIPMPDVYRKYADAIDWYVEHIKNDRTSELKYAAAVIALRYREWPNARQRLGQITELYCASKPEVGFKAYDAILQTYFIDYGVEDEEAEGLRARQAAQRSPTSSASRPAARRPRRSPTSTASRQIKASVKTTVITKRLQLSMENEEKGTNKELTMCHDGSGRHRDRHGHRDTATKPGEKPAPGAQPSKLSTQLDVGLALDLIDVVNANPKDPGAPTALNNACVIYEKLFQFGQATKCYERLYADYPESEWGKEALWNASRNHYRFFEFDQAVKGYMTVAQDPKFASSEHRKEALGLTASLLDNDQQYTTRRRHVQEVLRGDVRQAAGQRAGVLLRAATPTRRRRTRPSSRRCLKDFIKKFNKPAGGRASSSCRPT